MAADELRRLWEWLPEASRGPFVDVAPFTAGEHNVGRTVGLDYLYAEESFAGWTFHPHLYALREPRPTFAQLDPEMPGMDGLLLFVDATRLDLAIEATKLLKSVVTSRGLRLARTPLAVVVRGCDEERHPETGPGAVAAALGLEGRYALDADGIDGDPESELPAVYLAVHLVLKEVSAQLEAGTLTHMPALD